MDKVFTSNYLVLQPDFSIRDTLYMAENAYREGKKIVLYFVPDKKIRRKLLRYISVAILDEGQIGEVAKVRIEGLLSIKTAALRIYGRGVETVMVKMYDSRVLIFAEESFRILDCFEKEIGEINDGTITRELKMILKEVSNYS